MVISHVSSAGQLADNPTTSQNTVDRARRSANLHCALLQLAFVQASPTDFKNAVTIVTQHGLHWSNLAVSAVFYAV